VRLIRGTSALALAVGVVLVTTGASRSVPSADAPTVTSPLVTPSVPSIATALPLYEFSKTGTGTLPWAATSLASLDGGTTMIAGPRTAEAATGADVVAFATTAHTIGFVTKGDGPASFTNLASQLSLPPTADAPVPFFDSLGRLNLVYVAADDHVILVTQNATNAGSSLGKAGQFLYQAWLVRDLSVATESTALPNGVLATGEVTAVNNDGDDLFAVRTTTNRLVALTVPNVRPFNVTTNVAVAPTVTLGTNPIVVGSPIDGVVTLAATTSANHVDVFRQISPSTWSTTDLTTLIKAPTINGDLSATANSSDLYVAGSSVGSGDVELDSYSFATATWTNLNVTKKTADAALPGPSLAGELALTLVGANLSIAGAASGWGDLFNYSNTGTSGSWVAADVSANGGATAKTVGSDVAAVDPSGTVTFYAGGVDTPAKAGVGIYDIPSADLPHAVSDGWPILAVTGGLGTQSAPWVNVPTGATASALSQAIRDSADYAIGNAIQSSHKRETWLSFWTISGPIASQSAGPAAFKANGYAAGQAVARTIDLYGANGLGLKPDWVILDPEGYPDNHSQLDGYDVSSITGNGKVVTVTTASSTPLATGELVSIGQTGISALDVHNAPINVKSANTFTFPSTLKVKLADTGIVTNGAYFAANWSSIMTGWRQGIASVDPTLNAAIYTDESQYTEANIAASSMPVFMAISWDGGIDLPQPIPHSSNVLGFIEFGNVCKSGKVQTQLRMFDSPPWNGRYNTVQFGPPGYCNPHTP
jgi:hypothetical protein